jgi:hypothetical protein
MLYRQAGKTGQMVSILGFGCMRLPTREGKAHLIDEEEAQGMVDYAIRHGVNYFDTAYVYHSEVPFQAGMSELFLGRALKKQRQKVHVATKLPSWLVGSRADLDRYLDEQLKRLQTEHIDFYLVHSLTGELWNKLSQLGITEFLDAAIADGRIKHAGFSFHDEVPHFKTIVDAYDWSFCQIQYNLMDEDFQAGRAGLEYAAGGPGGDRHGALTRRRTHRENPARRASGVGQEPGQADAGRMGAAVCLEPAGSERGAERHERAGAGGGKHKNRQSGVGQLAYR